MDKDVLNSKTFAGEVYFDQTNDGRWVDFYCEIRANGLMTLAQNQGDVYQFPLANVDVTEGQVVEANGKGGKARTATGEIYLFRVGGISQPGNGRRDEQKIAIRLGVQSLTIRRQILAVIIGHSNVYVASNAGAPSALMLSSSAAPSVLPNGSGLPVGVARGRKSPTALAMAIKAGYDMPRMGFTKPGVAGAPAANRRTKPGAPRAGDSAVHLSPSEAGKEETLLASKLSRMSMEQPSHLGASLSSHSVCVSLHQGQVRRMPDLPSTAGNSQGVSIQSNAKRVDRHITPVNTKENAANLKPYDQEPRPTPKAPSLSKSQCMGVPAPGGANEMDVEVGDETGGAVPQHRASRNRAFSFLGFEDVDDAMSVQSTRMRHLGVMEQQSKQLNDEFNTSLIKNELARKANAGDDHEGDSDDSDDSPGMRASKVAWGNLIQNSISRNMMTSGDTTSDPQGLAGEVVASTIQSWQPGTVIRPQDTVEYFQLVNAGMKEANGYYRPHLQRKSDGVPVYVNDWPLDISVEMKRFAKGEKKYWGILRKNWNGHDKVDLYWTRSTDDWPPPRGWRCFRKDVDPAPEFKFVSQVFLRSFIDKTKKKDFDLDRKREASLLRYYGLVGKHGETRRGGRGRAAGTKAGSLMDEKEADTLRTPRPKVQLPIPSR